MMMKVTYVDDLYEDDKNVDRNDDDDGGDVMVTIMMMIMIMTLFNDVDHGFASFF